MRTINYSRLPKSLSRNIGLNVFEGKKYVYILIRTQFSGEKDRLWVVTTEEYHKYHDLTIGEQLNDKEIKELAEEAHCSIDTVRNTVSATAAQQFVWTNEPDATCTNYS